MAEQALQVQSQQFDRRQIEVIRATVAAGTSDAELALFLEVCKHRNLNPFAREIYAIMRSGKMTIQISIDGMRKLAERSGKYRGQKGPYFCGADGAWKEDWLVKTPPVAAKVGVLRADFDEPIWAVARYDAYCQPSSATWQKMPDVMIAKCAESLALRKAFPDEASGMYTHEEMAQAGKPDAPFAKRQPESPILETTAVVVDAVVEAETAQGPDLAPAIRKMRDHAAARATALGLEWEAHKREALGEEVPDTRLTANSFVKINGLLTRRENEQKASRKAS